MSLSELLKARIEDGTGHQPWGVSSPACIFLLYLHGQCAKSKFIANSIQIITGWLVPCVTSSCLFKWLIIQPESRKCSIWRRKSQGCHASGQYSSYPSGVIYYSQGTPKQSTFSHEKGRCPPRSSHWPTHWPLGGLRSQTLTWQHLLRAIDECRQCGCVLYASMQAYMPIHEKIFLALKRKQLWRSSLPRLPFLIN